MASPGRSVVAEDVVSQRARFFVCVNFIGIERLLNFFSSQDCFKHWH